MDKLTYKMLSISISTILLIVALFCAYLFWRVYWIYPWTRDAQVRSHVVRLAARVSGPVVESKIKEDNKFVNEGDLLFVIDPATFQQRVYQARSDLDAFIAHKVETQLEIQRRVKIDAPFIADEELTIYKHRFKAAEADALAAEAALRLAELYLQYTHVYAPATGYITNLDVYVGDYIIAGNPVLSLVESEKFYIEGYFKETQLFGVQVGDLVDIRLMGYYHRPFKGTVTSISRGIKRRNSDIGIDLLASVNPNLDWIRLAQRIPVRVSIDELPKGILLSVGMTATLVIKSSYDIL